MSELEHEWELALAQAQERARAAGRRDIEEYLNLRRRNDLLRRTGTEWLMNAFVLFAGDANRTGAGIQIEREEDHQFRRSNATMVGKRITLRRGVRALIVECGWPRKPQHGIVSGGGLACANVNHLGRSRANSELILVSSQSGSPRWLALEKAGDRLVFNKERMRQHFRQLLSDD